MSRVADGQHNRCTEQSSLGSDDSGIASSEGCGGAAIGTLGSRASMEDDNNVSRAPLNQEGSEREGVLVIQPPTTTTVHTSNTSEEDKSHQSEPPPDPPDDAHTSSPLPPPSSSDSIPVRALRLSLSSESGDDTQHQLSKPNESQSLLLRLFESKLFDMSMAISYLYKCKEPGVQQYIGNRLFSMPRTEAYFYLPQLVNMYVQSYEVAEILHPYLVHCCRHDTVFSLHTAWLLDAFSADTAHHKKKTHGTKFKNLILSDELR